MKILQLHYSLAPGGAERFVVDLSNRLSNNPDNVVILVTHKELILWIKIDLILSMSETSALPNPHWL